MNNLNMKRCWGFVIKLCKTMDASAEVLTVVLFSLGAFYTESPERIKKKDVKKKKIPCDANGE